MAMPNVDIRRDIVHAHIPSISAISGTVEMDIN